MASLLPLNSHGYHTAQSNSRTNHVGLGAGMLVSTLVGLMMLAHPMQNVEVATMLATAQATSVGASVRLAPSVLTKAEGPRYLRPATVARAHQQPTITEGLSQQPAAATTGGFLKEPNFVSTVLLALGAFFSGLCIATVKARNTPKPMAMMAASGGKDNGKGGGAATEEKVEATNFIYKIIDEDIETGYYDGRVATRFPPEPNGYLHLGHAKSICLNFRVAEKYGGTCNLRFDDTNPEKEDIDFVESIKNDVQWLGYQWDGEVRYSSDYFPQLYEYAVQLIKDGKAYVDSLTFEQSREYRGTLTTPGKNSPDRDRSIEDNLRLFQEMKDGKHPEGSLTLRLKIDMASPIMNMRDPVAYRIKFASHHQTGDEWCIYPMYDFTHCISDALEGITHSLCTLEFEGNRPLYEWILEALNFPTPPKQREFARLNMAGWIMSKRLLTQLVEGGHVDGWDDPRLPTLSGLRRRGYTPTAVTSFCAGLAIGKSDSVIRVEQLEAAVRAELELTALRRMVVLDPLKVTIENYPEGEVLHRDLPNHPSNEEMGVRDVLFERTVYIERDDFSEDPPKGYKRLTKDFAVRLRGSYVIKLKEVIYAEDGSVQELICTHDPDTLGVNPVGYKAKGVIHWVSESGARPCQINKYDKLFSVDNPDSANFEAQLNPESLVVWTGALMEQSLETADLSQRFQFERTGYFTLDPKAEPGATPVFNRICALKEGW